MCKLAMLRPSFHFNGAESERTDVLTHHRVATPPCCHSPDSFLLAVMDWTCVLSAKEQTRQSCP